MTDINSISSLVVRYEVCPWRDRFEVVVREVFKPADGKTVFDDYEDAMRASIHVYDKWIGELKDKSLAVSDELAAYLNTKFSSNKRSSKKRF